MKFTSKLFFIAIVLFGFTYSSNPQTSGLVNYKDTENRLFTKEDNRKIAEEEPSSPQGSQTVESQPSAPNPTVSKENISETVGEMNSNSQLNQTVQPQSSESSQLAQPLPAQTPAPNPPAAGGTNTVEGIGFEAKDGVGVVTIKTSAPVKYQELPKEERRLSLRIEDVAIPDEFQVARDVGDFNSPIAFISSFRDPAKPNDVIIIMELKKDAPKDSPVEIKQDGNLITAKFGKPKEAEKLTEEVQAQQPPKEAPFYAFDFRIAATPGAKKVYRGQLVSFDFKDADVRDVLRVLADVSGFNFVVSQDVKGTVTLKLTNVPWDQALEVVLENAGLGALVEGNVIKIAPLRTLQARQNEIQQAASSKEQLEPLITKQIFINYATGEELKPLIEPVLSKRGELKIDVRTNSILVTDTAPRVAHVEELVKELDTRTPQVLIESRIVQATLDFTRELGVQFGANYKASAALPVEYCGGRRYRGKPCTVWKPGAELHSRSTCRGGHWSGRSVRSSPRKSYRGL
jgi:type IV pilus assembly protein PilQ